MFINGKETAENNYDAMVIATGIGMSLVAKEICKKEHKLSSYFSSEIGMTQARNYLSLARKLEIYISYHQEDKPWAT